MIGKNFRVRRNENRMRKRESMKKVVIMVFLLLFLTGCVQSEQKKAFDVQYFDYFDTFTSFTVPFPSRSAIPIVRLSSAGVIEAVKVFPVPIPSTLVQSGLW